MEHTVEQSLLLSRIHQERHGAHHKHGVTSMEQADVLDHYRLSILTEEVGEVARVLNDLRHDLDQEGSRSGSVALVRAAERAATKELIQVAAMAYAWAANLEGDVLE